MRCSLSGLKATAGHVPVRQAGTATAYVQSRILQVSYQIGGLMHVMAGRKR
jgi:hypothetical protein